MMFKKNKPVEAVVEVKTIRLGVVVDGEIVEVFGVNSPRLASLFLSNPTFVDLED